MLRIKDARNARGWSQEKLAEAMGTTQQSIQRWESGQDIKSSQILELSKTLNVTVSFLLGVDSDSQYQQIVSTDNERELITHFRQLSHKAQQALLVGLHAYTSTDALHI